MNLTQYLKIATATWFVSTCGFAADSSEERFLEWNHQFMKMIQLANYSPGLAARNLAVVHGAVYEVINSKDEKFEGFLPELPPEPDEWDVDRAMIEAFWQTSSALFVPYRAQVDRLRENQLAQLDEDTAAVEGNSQEYGRAVAVAFIKACEDDGSTSTVTYVPARDTETGKWRRTPPRYRPPEAPHWGNVRPFGLSSPEQFRPGGPPPMDSPQYLEALSEIRSIGWANGEEAHTRSAEQTQLANFWSCFDYSSTPGGHWNEIAAKISNSEGIALPDLARLFALLNFSLTDAGIAAWDCKYHYRFWRPIQAIHRADEDPLEETEPDATWDSLLEAPPHPEYVSGHSTFSGAGARLLQLFFERDACEFVATNAKFPGIEYHYDSLWKCAEDIGISRIYGGVHYAFSNRDGLELGRNVAEWDFAHCLRPVTDEGS